MQESNNITHNGTDGAQIRFDDLIIDAEEEVTTVTGTADTTYSENEQAMLNDIKTKLNAVLALLQNKNLMK